MFRALLDPAIATLAVTYADGKAGQANEFEASLVVEDEHVQVDLRLVDAGRGRKTWGRRFDGEVNEVPDLQRRVATAVAQAASQVEKP